MNDNTKPLYRLSIYPYVVRSSYTSAKNFVPNELFNLPKSKFVPDEVINSPQGNRLEFIPTDYD